MHGLLLGLSNGCALEIVVQEADLIISLPLKWVCELMQETLKGLGSAVDLIILLV